MIPIRDNNPTHHTPYVTVAIILANAIVFLMTGMGQDADISQKYGFTPAQLIQSSDEYKKGTVEQIGENIRRQLGPRIQFLSIRDMEMIQQEASRRVEAATALPAPVKLFTCMFLHGGWMHLIGNMWFLWIFGINVEDRLGPILFPIFYLATGVIATLTHTFLEQGYIPLIGASGAVSGIMGGYLLLFSKARIFAIVPVFYYIMTVSLPAWIFMIFYIVIQNLYPATFSGGQGGVAHWAHIGGFVAGLATIKLLPHRRIRSQPVIEDEDADLVI